MQVIATIHNDFDGKFAVPRQAGLVPSAVSRVVFEPAFRNREALRGLEEYSHIWLIWLFSGNRRSGFEPTVRPPRLGGNRRVGVFATRSPYRPNPIGLSCVRLRGIRETKDEGWILEVEGADLVNGTPILDIKPYLPYTDAHPGASSGFAGRVEDYAVEVVCENRLLQALPEDRRATLLELLRQDPRPGYQREEKRVYGFSFAGCEVRFEGDGGVLTVLSVERERGEDG